MSSKDTDRVFLTEKLELLLLLMGTALCCSVVYSTVLYCAVLSDVLCYVLYCTVLYCAVLYCTVLCAVLCYVLYCVVLCCET